MRCPATGVSVLISAVVPVAQAAGLRQFEERLRGVPWMSTEIAPS